jgi:hypothetical protein
MKNYFPDYEGMLLALRSAFVPHFFHLTSFRWCRLCRCLRLHPQPFRVA